MKKKIIAALFAVVLILSVIVPGTVIFAEDADLSVHYSRLNDMEGLLDDAAAQRVSARLDEVRSKLDFDIVIVTCADLGGKTMEEYADDFYDYNGFGCGSNRDGALLLLNMEDRKWHISTRGYGITAFTDYGIQQAGDAIKEYFDTDCEKAFDLFIDKCEEYVNLAREGKPYDRSLSLIWIPISLIVGFVIANIVVGSMKKKLKSVRSQAAASSYVREDSLNITDSRDIYLYATVTRTAKPDDSSSSGGSSTHTSSSGATHGGGGGSF